MKKVMLGLIAVIVMVFAVKAFAITKLESISIDFANSKSNDLYQTGSRSLVNTVLTNGDIEVQSVFTPDGNIYPVIKSGAGFYQFLQSVFTSGSVSADSFTNADIGQVNVEIGIPDVYTVNEYTPQSTNTATSTGTGTSS